MATGGGKGGGKRRRDPSEYNPAERKSIAGYYRQQKRRNTGAVNQAGRDDGSGSAGPSSNYDDNDQDMWSGNDSDFEDITDQPEQAQQVAPMGRGPGGGGGSGGGQAAMGVQEGGGRTFGTRFRTRSKTFTKSFVVYINNGVNFMNWTQNPGSTTQAPSVTWSEGWQMMTGFGQIKAAMNPTEWWNLSQQASRIRIKSCSFLLEDMIPFQEALDAQGNPVAVATASNRPNVWYIKDTQNLLPKIQPGSVPDHNLSYQLPYGSYTDTQLPTPIFTLNNVDTAAMPYRVGPLPPQALPQAIYSLVDQGLMKTYNAGQKISETWVNPSKQWCVMRLNNDFQSNYRTNGVATTAHSYQLLKAVNLTATYNTGAGSRVTDNNSPIAASNTDTTSLSKYTFDATSQNITAAILNYTDTGFHVQEGGPPYCLIKVEPYYDTQNNAANIYMQAHLHYSMTFEWEELQNYNTLAWINTPNVNQTGNFRSFNNMTKELTCSAGERNEQNTLYGPSEQSAMYV